MGLVIKRIAPQKKDKSRLTLFFDHLVVGLYSKIAREFNLSPGREVGEELLAKILKKDWEERVWQKGLKLLSLRPRSEKELEFRLKKFLATAIKKGRKNIPFPLLARQVVKKGIKRLKKEGLINDREFISWWLEQRQQFRPRSTKEIIIELKRKGIDPRLIKEELEKGGYSDEKAARALIRKKLRLLSSSLKEEEKKKKLINFLLRKGFSYQLILPLIDEELFSG